MACNRRTQAAFAAALLTSSAAAFAQSVPSPTPSPSPRSSAPANPCGSILSIVNRPTIGTGACTVQPHHVDIETGWQNTTVTGSSGSVTPSYGASLVRFGTGDERLDLEVTPPNNTGGATALGAKYVLGYDANAVWGANVQAGSGQYIGNFNWGYTLNSTFGLSGTLGFNDLRGTAASGTSQMYFAFVPTLEASASLPGATQLFGEYAYFSQAGPGLRAKSEFDAGIIHDLGPHWQIDVEFGATPTVIYGATQRYVGAGLSFMN